MKYPNEMHTCDGGFNDSDLCAAPALPAPSMRDLAVEMRETSSEILARSKAINNFLIKGSGNCEETEKVSDPQCLRDELVFVRRQLEKILRELSFQEQTLGIMMR